MHSYHCILTSAGKANCMATLMPVAYDLPKCMRLTQLADNNSTLEEVVVRVQGILCRKELPPINNISRLADVLFVSPGSDIQHIDIRTWIFL